MYRALESSRGAVVAERLRTAHTHWTRLRGLLGTPTLPAGEGLWLKPCQQVHMFGMRYPVDVAFLDDEYRIVGLVPSLLPWRVSPKLRQATSVVEVPAGTLERLGLIEGLRIAIDGEADPDDSGRLDTFGTLVCNLVVAALYGLFAAAHLTKGWNTGQWATTMPLVAQEALLVLLFLGRRRSLAVSSRPLDWAIGIAGTLLPLFMRPAERLGPLSALGEVLQVAGLSFAVAGLTFLGRSIGIVAANRGVKTAGAYRLVRHPMYVGYLIGYVGYALSYPSARNALLVAMTLLALNARAVVEERFLAHDPLYRRYLLRTHWRFVPYLY